MSRFVPPKMLPVPSSHLRCAHRVRAAPVRGSVSGKGKHLGSERRWWTHEAGGMAEAAQVSRVPWARTPSEEKQTLIVRGFVYRSCRNGKRGQGWERKYVVLDGYKVITYETEPRDGLWMFLLFPMCTDVPYVLLA